MENIRSIFLPIVEAIETNWQERRTGVIALIVIVVAVIWFRHRKKKKSSKQAMRIVSDQQPVEDAPLIDVSIRVDEGKKSARMSQYQRLSVKEFRQSCGEYIAFDIETTGFDRDADQIIEIGAAKVINGRIADTFSALVNPGLYIPIEASRVNHITDDMVRSAPPIAKVLPRFLAFVGDTMLAAHNASFDMTFIIRDSVSLGLVPPSRCFDTMNLFELWPEAKNKKLSSLLSAAGIKNKEAHRALGDAEALAELLVATVPRMPDPDTAKRRAHSTLKTDAVDDRLHGMRFVLTGDVPGMSRADIEQLIRLHGGRPTGSISAATNYLAVGDYPEASEGFISAKKKQAMEMISQGGTIRIITMKALFDMMGETLPC